MDISKLATTSRLPRRVRAALRSFVLRRTADDELDEELQFHYQQMAAYEAVRTGMHARAVRRRPFGIDSVKEACRDMRTLRPLEQFLQDVRFGARLLLRSPVFTLVAILSLAIGIGANSAIFSLINTIVLRTLPVERPEQLHVAQVTDPRGESSRRFSYPAFQSARDLVAGRAELAAATRPIGLQVAAQRSDGSLAQAESGRVQLVSDEYFQLLRQRPQRGRLIEPGDNRVVGEHFVAVISDGYWTRKLDRAPDAVGRTLTINGAPFTIVGVAAPGFFGAMVEARVNEIWIPLVMQHTVRYAGNMSSRNGDDQRPWSPQREIAWLTVFARMPSDAVPSVADAMTRALQQDYAQRAGYREDAQLRRRYQADRVTLISGARGLSDMREDLSTPLVVLLVMVGLLLAIACANLASLLLARATSRQREMAIRLSIGAGRGRLVRQLLTESLLLALAGGALGLLAGYWGLTLGSRGTPLGSIDVSPDWRVIGYTLFVSVLTGVLFGLLPALRGTRVSLSETLTSHARGVIGGGAHGRRLPAGKLLIAGQIAFSLLLLIVAALFARSLQQLMRVDVGVDRDHLLLASIDPRAAGYAEAELPDLYRRVIARMEALPGVTSASISANGLFGGSRMSSAFVPEGYAPGPDERLGTDEEFVTPGYFHTVGLTIAQGRAFTPQDVAGARKVTIINETMAQRYFRNQNPIGKRWSYDRDFKEDVFEIVGVVRDAHYLSLKSEAPNLAYRPALQELQNVAGSVEIRTAGNPAALVDEVRQALRQAEPRLVVTSIDTLDARVARSMGRDTLLTWTTLAFGVVALALACLGLYGTISYAVTRRTAELGVRIALGAGRGTVQWLILREALLLVLIGLAVGLPLAFLAARGVATLLYGITPFDPLSHGGAVVILILIAALAAYLPALRASRIDPMHALREDQ